MVALQLGIQEHLEILKIRRSRLSTDDALKVNREAPAAFFQIPLRKRKVGSEPGAEDLVTRESSNF